MGDLNIWQSYGVLAAALALVGLLVLIRQKVAGVAAAAPRARPGEAVAAEATEWEPVSGKIAIGNAQTIGRRQEQDDYFASSITRVGTMAVIADGISGVAHGRMSSTLAVTMFSREYLKVTARDEIPGFFHKAASLSNRAILEQLGGAIGGTTLVAAVICEGYLHWGAVGDSLLLLFRDGEFIPVNSKHTLEKVLEARVLAGEITREEAKANPMRSHLTNYLGYGGFKSMEIGEPVPLEADDIVILCSDGVCDALTEVELEQILLQRMPPEETAEEIIASVERKGYKHQDNATVIILEQAR
ncbi:PP2C family protein-serine/threonine phosphatase [Paenibacillus sanfengchensis]|uniref:PP2C family protein-serine/threonine phosphatase n=1 Tax=Paenibacillus TaxID=44249 RepID=UPI002FDF0AE8